MSVGDVNLWECNFATFQIKICSLNLSLLSKIKAKMRIICKFMHKHAVFGPSFKQSSKHIFTKSTAYCIITAYVPWGRVQMS